jgi:hypothetical protein
MLAENGVGQAIVKQNGVGQAIVKQNELVKRR